MIKRIINIYVILKCLYAFGWRSGLVILRWKCGKLSDTQLNRIVKQGAVKILKIIKAHYDITYTSSVPLDGHHRYIFMSNHQSYMDILLIYATVIGNIRFIGKKELFEVPIFGKLLSIMGCISIDRENPNETKNFFQAAKEKLSNNVIVWVFPEGTRSRTGQLLPFKMGCFRLAYEFAAQIVPVAINNTNKVLPPDKRTFGLNQSIQIRIGKPIDACSYSTITAQKQLLENVRQAIMQLMEAF